jgi:type VI secretion system protein ImpB
MPKSRVNFRYTTEDGNADRTIELPLRLLVMADFAKGQSADARKAFDEREKRRVEPGNLDRLMRDMDIRLKMTDVKNHLRPEEGMLSLNMPLRGMDDLAPQNVAKNVPELATLLKKREVLHDLLEKANAGPKDYKKLLEKLGLESGKSNS